MLKHVFYVFWRLGEAHSYVFYVSWKLWGVHLYVFYECGRRLGGPACNDAKGPGGSLLKNLRPEASEASRLAEARVLRVVEALGSSFVRFLFVREAPAGSRR